MDREATLTLELRALQNLCDETRSREERQELMYSLGKHIFIEPEHQTVFESIRALLQRGSISEGRLRVHLNNRGFPDTDVEKYFRAAPATGDRVGPAQKTP